MEAECPSAPMVERMLAVAGAWTEETGRTLTALADQVLSSSQFFERVGAGRDITLRNYARMVAFLADPASWPASGIPDRVMGLVERIKHDVDANRSVDPASPDKAEEIIPPFPAAGRAAAADLDDAA